jgi:hypothetical protein
MPQKFGSNDTQLATTGGAVTADNGSVLVSGDSQTESALLFGPASLREIQSGIANGDFAIMPNDPYGNITADNALPYWTFTDFSSAGAITCAIVADTAAGSGNKLRWSVAANTPANKQALLTRFVPIFGTQNQAFSYAAELTSKCSVTSGIMTIAIQQDFFQADQVTTVGSSTLVGTPFSTSLITVSTGASPVTTLAVPPSAAFVRLTINVSTISTSPGTVSTCDVFETRLLRGDQALFVAEQTTPGTYAPALIQQQSGTLSITPAGGLSLPKNTLSKYENIGGSDTTTITTAGTYYALTSASNPSGFLDVDFTPQFVGQRWLFTFTGYASLNTTVAQYAFIRADVTTSAAVAIVTPWAYSRSENPGTSGRGGTVAITKVWVADRTTACKFKLYGTAQTTNGLILSTAYSSLTAYPIG